MTWKAKILLTDGMERIFEHTEPDDDARVIRIAGEAYGSEIAFIPYENILMVTWEDEEIPEEVNEP